MSPVVFGAVLLAAAMHAGWNALLKIKLEPLLGMALITTACSILACLALPIVGWPRAEAWPWVIASVGLHFGYYVCLAEAYRRADLSQMYPIARGSAPLLTALFSVVVLREPMPAIAAFGVVTLASGVVLMSLRGGRSHALPDPVAVAFALATAVMISSYTVVDGIGARVAADPNAYSAALFFVDGAPTLLLALWLRGMGGVRQAAGFIGPGLAGGALSLAAYWTVIWAMTVAPIPLVAALRESSVLFGSLIAIFVLREPIGRYRIVAAAFILAGLVLIRLG
jgi:drug/metabolite transporter (DMT)-like permease